MLSSVELYHVPCRLLTVRELKASFPFPEIFLDDEDRNRVIRGTEEPLRLLFPCTHANYSSHFARSKQTRNFPTTCLVHAALDNGVLKLMY